MLTPWTGQAACALQAALRMSNEAFAAHLGIAPRTVGGWHQKPLLKPKSEMQQLLDTALDRATPAAQARFHELLDAEEPAPVESNATNRLVADPGIGAAVEWLDRAAGCPAGTSRREVAALLPELDRGRLEDRGARRSRIRQLDIVRALSGYYADAVTGCGLYGARYGDGGQARTTVLTRPEWLDLACPLTPDHDRLTLAPADIGTTVDATRAARRLAETLTLGGRLVDAPLYCLTGLDLGKGHISGTVGLTQFVHYALTMDLLEGELMDAIASGSADLPLRDRYLSDLAAVLDVRNRVCAGGVLALSAFARPATAYRPADYVLLIQERSGQVLNAAQRLAVIPKGFHQPLRDFGNDTQLGATLARELEEELFGREETDCTIGDPRRADPMHHSRLSEPMRWLTDDPTRLTMECTGFGLNLVSGNFEFASLVAVRDEEFWSRFGGQIAANWETAGIRQYSSRDAGTLLQLIDEPGWSNEGLFALLQGLRRLAEIDGSRVQLPHIAVQIG